MTDGPDLWKRYRKLLCKCPSVGLSLDVSRMDFGEDLLKTMGEPMEKAFDAMERLEAGEIVNPDEGRAVGHYWLRAPGLAPSEDLARQVTQTVQRIRQFASDVHARKIVPMYASRFTEVLVVGIGGSALGPQLVHDALGHAHGSGTGRDRMKLHFLDNTDPDGFDRVFFELGARLKATLVLVISKSGGTKETRNGMLEVEAAFRRAGADFARHAVAVTGEGSALHRHAVEQNWIATFPMWDWVGGRTSVTSAVGLLPAALQGVDIEDFLHGATAMDVCTRSRDLTANPAALLALAWHHASAGRGEKAMVVLPYKDRLLLLSRYLQQLVMESLGKEKNLAGEVVHQGLTVYGNKGSTDQHAYVQQLRDGTPNFFASFIVVLQDRANANARKNHVDVDPGVASGDYLHGFWLGTRRALHEAGRPSLTLTLDKLNAHRLGALIALHERAVGLYASLVGINAYHQPGVEAGKKAAEAVLDLQRRALAHLRGAEPATVEEIAQAIGAPDEAESIHHMLEHLVANRRHVSRSGKKYRALA